MTQVLFEAAIGVVVMAAVGLLLFAAAAPIPGWLSSTIGEMISAGNF